jgi:hypothetical protein
MEIGRERSRARRTDDRSVASIDGFPGWEPRGATHEGSWAYQREWIATVGRSRRGVLDVKRSPPAVSGTVAGRAQGRTARGSSE